MSGPLLCGPQVPLPGPAFVVLLPGRGKVVKLRLAAELSDRLQNTKCCLETSVKNPAGRVEQGWREGLWGLLLCGKGKALRKRDDESAAKRHKGDVNR